MRVLNVKSKFKSVAGPKATITKVPVLFENTTSALNYFYLVSFSVLLLDAFRALFAFSTFLRPYVFAPQLLTTFLQPVGQKRII